MSLTETAAGVATGLMRILFILFFSGSAVKGVGGWGVGGGHVMCHMVGTWRSVGHMTLPSGTST